MRRQIDQLRDTPISRASSLPAAAERATVDSLPQQLRAYRSEISRLASRTRHSANNSPAASAPNAPPPSPGRVDPSSKTCPQRQTPYDTGESESQIKRMGAKTRPQLGSITA